MAGKSTTAAAAQLATVVALLLTAHHVSARAVRDALFLSTFPASALPAITVASAATSLLLAVWSTRWQRRGGPARVAPRALLVSALLLFGIWALAATARPIAAVLFYLHVAALGSLLLSLFWSVVNERLDPHALRRHVGRIGAGASAGGLIGGGVAFGAASLLPGAALLPVLALVHVVAALLLRGLGPSSALPLAESAEEGASFSGELGAAATPAPGGMGAMVAAFRQSAMLRDLALLVTACAGASALVDFLFKAGLQGIVPGEAGLMRAFALFHGVAALLTILTQALLLRRTLDRGGVARTVAALPAALGGGAVFTLLAPGIGAYAVVWLLESVLRGSLFRSGYEMLYTPLPAEQKRAGKALIDIGASRLGDITGAAITLLLLSLPLGRVDPWILAAIAALGLVGVMVSVRLDRGYRAALERGLRSRSAGIEVAGDEDPYTRTLVLDSVALRAIREAAGPMESDPGLPRRTPLARPPADPLPPTAVTPAAVEPEIDPRNLTQTFPLSALAELVQAAELEGLRSDDPERVREALAARTFSAAAIPLVVGHLADDRTATAAADAVRRALPDHTSALVAALENPETPLQARRRLPRLLRSSTSPEVTRALLHGLLDDRFDVRAASARALVRLREERPGFTVPHEVVFAAVEREIRAGRLFWESRAAIDQEVHDEGEEPAHFAFDAFVRERSSRALDHVFTLLSLVLNQEGLRLAYRALHTEDEVLRGYALEFLETELPQRVRDRLRPFLGIPDAPPTTTRSREQVIADLLRENETVRLRLDEIRKRIEDG